MSACIEDGRQPWMFEETLSKQCTPSVSYTIAICFLCGSFQDFPPSASWFPVTVTDGEDGAWKEEGELGQED